MSTPSKTSTTPPTETDLSWIKHVQSEKQKEPERLEEAAKFLVGIISISLTIFISNRPVGLAGWTDSWFVAATVFWIISVWWSFLVLFPSRYTYNPDSPEDIERMHNQVIRTKRLYLKLSLGFFLLALGFASYAFLAG